jgi:RecA/RadA recombinase
MARARNRRTPDAWGAENREQSLDSMFETMRQEAARELGRDDISIGTEAEALLVGLPLPALCLRYLFQSTVYPLSRIIQITGEEGSCKSAFQFEMMRWHHVYGGGSVFIENEHKDSPELRQSLLQWNQQWLRRHETVQTFCLEEWMNVLTVSTNVARHQQDMPGGPGHTIPIMFSVDSLMATAPRESIDKIEREGHATRGFALAANLISSYMRTMPARIQNFPFTICGTNHLKPSTDFMGRPTHTIPGGKSVKFMETFEIEMHRAPSGDIDKLDYGGIRCRLVARKNSLGPSRKQIVAELLWWHEDIDGITRQRTAWDWDTASVNLLLSFETAKGKQTLYNRLKEICPITVKNKQMAKCPTLGINDHVEYRVIGAALERRPDLLAQIYGVLGIQQRRAFQPGMDYRDLLSQERADGEEATAGLYENIENIPLVDPDLLDPSGTAIPPSEQGMTGEFDEEDV